MKIIMTEHERKMILPCLEKIGTDGRSIDEECQMIWLVIKAMQNAEIAP